MNTPGIAKHPARGFTLIELLVVIAIIAILAGLLLPAGAAIKRNAAKRRATVELQKVQLAIESYKAKLNHYPPDNTNNVAVNQLYFELLGVKPIGNPPKFESLDGNATIDAIDASASGIRNFYGNPNIVGFVNSGAASDENSTVAVKFMSELTPAQFLVWQNNGSQGAVLGTMVEGPFMLTNSATGKFINPFRYNASSPTNNVNSFDLWVDIKLGGKIYRICNWSENPIVNP